MNEIWVQSLIVIECYASFSDTSYMFNVPEDMNHFHKWLFICVLMEHLWSRYIIFNGKENVKLCSTLLTTDTYTV